LEIYEISKRKVLEKGKGTGQEARLVILKSFEGARPDSIVTFHTCKI